MLGITNPTEEYFKDGGWGWDGTRWRKLNLTFGYYDRYAERQEAENVPAGTQTYNFAAVPTGEVWVVTAFTAYCSTANPSAIALYHVATGVGVLLVAQQLPVVAWIVLPLVGTLVLKENDYLRAVFINCVLNDDVHAFAVGYKMKVA